MYQLINDFDCEKTYFFNLFTSLIFLHFCALATTLKILYMVPFPAPSNWFWLKNFSEELLRRGHYVTAVTNYKRPEPHSNYTEIIIDPPYNFSDFPSSDFFSMKFDNVLHNLYLTWDIGLKSTEHAFKDKNVAMLINRKDLSFDVVILEQFFHDSWLPFAKKFDAPLLTIATLGHADYFDNAMGLFVPSYVPHHVLTYTDQMNFYERCINFFWRLTDSFLRKYHYMVKMQQMAEHYFGNEFDGMVPSLIELERNISFRIINAHQSISFARPRMSHGLAYVAGIHIKQPKALPVDIQEFLDNGSEHGVIYFSFGSCIRSADLPHEKLHAFIEAFRLMKQQILWKFENETLPNIPSNVMIRKWVPQNDVLAHKNVVLFLTHGGIFGTQESIHWAVPMVFIPIYSDQFRNARRCVDAGLAEIISFQEVSVKNLFGKLNIVLNNERYKNRIQIVSEQFRDNLIDPMQEAMYWIEFLGRHKSNYPIFKPHAPLVSWVEYLYLDILLALTIILYILFLSTKYALKIVWRRFDYNRQSKHKVQ